MKNKKFLKIEYFFLKSVDIAILFIYNFSKLNTSSI